MRWVSDVVGMHTAYLAHREHDPTTTALVFLAAGIFRPYAHPSDGRIVDELALLRSGSVPSVVIIDGTAIDAVCAAESDLSRPPPLHDWLWAQSQCGARVVVVAPSPITPIGLAALGAAIDFNMQLYRELLCDFAPKVEYSGTLHERAGSSLPIVWHSPSMCDVTNEGLEGMILVAYPHQSTAAVAASTGQHSLVRCSCHVVVFYSLSFSLSLFLSLSLLS
jgi:hypothetical protein